MTKDWFMQMFLEEVKKLFPDSDTVDSRWYYIVKKDSVKEGKEITSQKKQRSMCGLRYEIVTQGYKYKEYDVIFKFSICESDHRKGTEPIVYNVNLYTNKNFGCEKAEELATCHSRENKKDQILDTVDFVLVRDADQEKIRLNERFIE
jgi:hypothetical protein